MFRFILEKPETLAALGGSIDKKTKQPLVNRLLIVDCHFKTPMCIINTNCRLYVYVSLRMRFPDTLPDDERMPFQNSC